jgi:uncharacterized protein (TIGR02145 family)
LCAGFVDGTPREHYEKSKAQFCDPRDGKRYVYVTIGEQTWMAENLNYNASDSKCYNNIETICETYGRLYNWATAKTACPSSWHLPSSADWNILMKLINLSCSDNSFCAGAGKLKAESGWNNSGNGNDTYGFSALPGGNGFGKVGDHGYWWSASDDGSNSNYAYYRNMYYYDEIIYLGSNVKSYLYSVRCVQD